MRLSHWFDDLPLRGKLYLCLVIFVIVPLLAVAVFINVQISNVMIQNARETRMQVLKQTRPPIEGLVRDLELISLTLLSDDKMQEMIKYHIGNTGQDLESRAYDFNISIQPLMVSRPYIWSICVSRGKTVIFQYGDRVNVEDIQFENAVAALKGRPFWTSVYDLENRSAVQRTAIPVISLIRTVNDLYKMQAIGTERISIREEYLCDLFAGIHHESAGAVFIIDSAGRILSSPDKTQLGIDLSRVPYIQTLLKQPEGFFQARLDNQDVTVFHYPIERTGWTVVQWLPDRVINQQTVLVNFIILASIALCMLFGILFSMVQNRSINRPIRQMVDEMDKVQSGNFEIDLQVKNRDEIGNLSRQFLTMVNRIKTLIDSVYKSQIKEREAELIALEAQINPHFLYNTLDSIRWLAYRNRDYAVSEQIEALSDMFRHALNKGQEMTTVRSELDHLKQYIVIQKYRYGDRIDFVTEIENNLLDLACPKLILQPLVENAIQHGLEKKTGMGKVTIKIFRSADTLFFEVSDDGIGTNQEIIRSSMAAQDSSHRVFALKNIHDRIQLKYGKAYGLSFSSVEDVGTTVQCTLPVDTGIPSESQEAIV